MVARRLLILMLILLGISTLAAALVPAPDSSEDDEPTASTASTETLAEGPTGTLPDTLPQGVRKKVAIDVPGEKIQEVPIELGDRLELTICSPRTDLIEIPRLGLVEALSANSPARVDVLPTAQGTYGINFVSDGKAVARIRVDPPTKGAPEEPDPAAKSARCGPARR